MSEQNEKSSPAGPPYEYQGGEIRLDKMGRWYHDGVEITHQRTMELFHRSITKGEGGYFLEIGHERARIVVEDTPYMVRRVDVHDDRAVIRLTDGSEEDLDPGTLRVGNDNVLYCDVKKGEFPARFFQAAYYQLMLGLEETADGYAVRIGDRRWPIRMEDGATRENMGDG